MLLKSIILTLKTIINVYNYYYYNILFINYYKQNIIFECNINFHIHLCLDFIF